MTHMTYLHTDSYLIIHVGKCNARNHPLNGRFIMILLLTLHQMQQVQSHQGKRTMAVPLDQAAFGPFHINQKVINCSFNPNVYHPIALEIAYLYMPSITAMNSIP